MSRSKVVIVRHMSGKASDVGSIASRSLMADIKLLSCRIGSRNLSDCILRLANLELFVCEGTGVQNASIVGTCSVNLS
jgi:hypothetical protein